MNENTHAKFAENKMYYRERVTFYFSQAAFLSSGDATKVGGNKNPIRLYKSL